MAIFEKWKRNAAFTDGELLKKYAQTSENQYFSELFKRYTHLVYGVCMKYLKDSDKSKDAVMVLFEKLLEELKTREIDNFSHWIHIVAKNHCLMQLRKNSIETSFPENFEAQFMENEFELHPIVDTKQNVELLEKSIGNLALEQRNCIELFYLQEKTYQEVAQSTGYSLNQVKSYIQNGKRNLYLYMTRKNAD
ncbi:MAG: RNA polymerase sigma factor [Cytophagales bacterium]